MKDRANDFIGKIVNVKIDRPLNSKHPKHGFEYPVNYGFIPGTISGDGEELDAYILGVDIPVEEYKGKCIAVIHRINDNDDKLIVVPEGKEFTDEEIRNLTNFQEQYFKSIIIRSNVGNNNSEIQEKSCGCIIIDDGKVLLVRHNVGHWGFPKGHVEENETEEQTAKREVKEETNIDVEIDLSKRYTETYISGKGLLKEVVYFLSKKIGGDLIKQDSELSDIRWVKIDEALDLITYKESKELFKKVINENNL